MLLIHQTRISTFVWVEPSVEEKISTIAKEMYGAGEVEFYQKHKKD